MDHRLDFIAGLLMDLYLYVFTEVRILYGGNGFGSLNHNLIFFFTPAIYHYITINTLPITIY